MCNIACARRTLTVKPLGKYLRHRKRKHLPMWQFMSPYQTSFAERCRHWAVLGWCQHILHLNLIRVTSESIISRSTHPLLEQLSNAFQFYNVYFDDLLKLEWSVIHFYDFKIELLGKASSVYVSNISLFDKIFIKMFVFICLWPPNTVHATFLRSQPEHSIENDTP